MPTLSDLDIREGDILTVEGKEYPVRKAEAYRADEFVSASFARMAKVSASLSRNLSDGTGSYSKTLIVGAIPCTPLDPLSSREVSEYRQIVNAPMGLLKTYAASRSGFYKLVLEDLK